MQNPQLREEIKKKVSKERVAAHATLRVRPKNQVGRKLACVSLANEEGQAQTCVLCWFSGR